MAATAVATPLQVYEAQSSRPKVWLGYRLPSPPTHVTEYVQKLVQTRFPQFKFARFKLPGSDKETEDYHATMAYGLDAENYVKCKAYMENEAKLTTDDLHYPTLDVKEATDFDMRVGTRVTTDQKTVLVWISLIHSARYEEAKQHVRKTFLPANQTVFANHAPHTQVMYAEVDTGAATATTPAAK